MSPRSKGSKKTRFTFWLPADTLAELTQLQHATAKESVADVIREAIRVYHNLLKASAEGVELFFQEGKEGEKGRVWLLPGPFPFSRKTK